MFRIVGVALFATIFAQVDKYTADANTPNKLKVDIYYESLCPDSIRFITNKLYPNYPHIRDYVDITFIPFGKSNSINGGEDFECQHGPPECYGNKVQACVLDFLTGSQDAQVEYVACQMKPGASRNGKECERQHVPPGLYDSESCVGGRRGTDLQLYHEILTNKISPSFVPTVVYNGVFDQQLQNESQGPFLQVVCRLLEYAPPICQDRFL